MEKSLFDAFDDVSSKEWKQKIHFELKGKDYNQTLIHKTNSSLSIKPFYHPNDSKQLDNNNQSIYSGTKICQEVFITKETVANKIALKNIQEVTQSLLFIASKPFDVTTVLKEIPTHIELQFQLHFLDVDFFKLLIKETNDYPCYLNIDIIGNLVKTGNWFQNLNSDFDALNEILDINSSNTTTLLIDTNHYQNAGATIVQQVTYGVAHLNEYLNYFGNKTLPKIQFKCAIGSVFFLEISKLKALKHLATTIAKAHDLDLKFDIICQASKRNKTIYHSKFNNLRIVSESLSALIGGVNTIITSSSTGLFKRKNNTSEQFSKQLIAQLLEEKNYIINNQGYYIENLSKEIAEKSLTLIKDIEKGGGFLKQLKEGTIQKKIKTSREVEQIQFDENELQISGANINTNKQETIQKEIEIYPFLKKKYRKSLIEPIVSKRIVERLEQKRLKNES